MIPKPLNRSFALCFGAALVSATMAHAQTTYPGRPITVLVSSQAGTGGDVAARGILEKLSAALGQPVVVENLPGAGGMIAAQRLMRAPPDGYTLAVLPSGMTALPHLDPTVKFDVRKDVAAIGMVAGVASVLFVHPSVPAKSVAEFVALARQDPGKITYASGGVGSAQHLATEMFKSATGTDLLHVPYKGSGQATLDVVAGRVDSAIQGVVQVAQQARAGQVRLLAWTGRQRNPLFPELPTMQEAGVKGYVYESWLGLFGPNGLPPAVVARLNTELARAAGQPDLRERWAPQGMEAKALTPAQMDAQIREEFDRDARIIREKNIKAN